MDTFVIRLWTPADDVGVAAHPRGVAHHVASGRNARFRDGTELLALLDDLRRSDDEPQPTLPGATGVNDVRATDDRGRDRGR